MLISEKQALRQLVALGLMEPEIADIIETLAKDKAVDLEPIEGVITRPLILLLDKSSSMKPHKQAMIDGQHHLINSLLGAAGHIDVYFGQILFNHEVEEYFQDMVPLRDSSDSRRAHPKVKLLDHNNYNPQGGTALYDTIVHALAMLSPQLVYAEEMGQQVMSHIAVITDGIDEHSKTKPETLKKVIDFALEAGIIHRITLVGLGNYDYEAVGESIGIEHIIEGTADPKEIRRAMDLISSHVVEDSL